ncbi:hypothetical protein EH32_03010 [Erythrobacter litoralis]|uniref:Uncharacterized protein n=1 Tax=Erythrobacter litoralis TaxID=39960 RepID=A0A074M982_9SPHN|nr:hypothetical protein EH32_03010 [Erythrobacter litoralis]
MGQYGAFGWFCVALFTFFISAAALALLSRTRLWRVEAKVREKLSGESSPFDPMAKEYHNKRLFISDLAPAGRKFVIGKTFHNCEIIGPGTIKLLTRSDANKPWPVVTNNVMFFTDCIETDPTANSESAIFFPDCSFHGCHFFNLTLMFDERTDGVGWNWITRDYRQLSLPQIDHSEDETET